MTSLESLDYKFSEIATELSDRITDLARILYDNKLTDKSPTSHKYWAPKPENKQILTSEPLKTATAYTKPEQYMTEEIRDPKTGKVISSKTSPVVKWDTQTGKIGSSGDDAWLGGRKTRGTRKTGRTRKNRRYSRK
jgi:hypothetical protein